MQQKKKNVAPNLLITSRIDHNQYNNVVSSLWDFCFLLECKSNFRISKAFLWFSEAALSFESTHSQILK